jgi:hypothetical protein
MEFKFNFRTAIDVYVIIAETLEHLLTSDSESSQCIFVDRNQVWFNAIQISDKQDIGLYETVLPPMWKRIYAAFVKSDSLQIPIYADEWFTERLGCLSVDAFVNGCIACAEKNPIIWERILIGAGEKRDYRTFLNYVINN